VINVKIPPTHYKNAFGEYLMKICPTSKIKNFLNSITSACDVFLIGNTYALEFLAVPSRNKKEILN